MAEPHHAPPSFSQRAIDGARVVCRVCGAAQGRHDLACPLLALDRHVKELTAHIGLFVAAMKETLESITAVLQDRREDRR